MRPLGAPAYVDRKELDPVNLVITRQEGSEEFGEVQPSVRGSLDRPVVIVKSVDLADGFQ